MKKLHLSEVEKKGVKIGWASGDLVGTIEPQAMGKLLSEKPAFAEGITNALGRVWCRLKGILCKTVGENIFLFTFLQVSGKRKALEEGPWMFDNDLMIVEDFDANKTIDDYKFESFPIWVRIFNLPLGRMNKKTGEELGEAIGEFISVETDESGMAQGKYLRVNVRMKINKPLLRGLVVSFGDDDEGKWCRFEYEFLPNFCFTCGFIGHTDKACSIQLGRGETQQYEKRLKWTPSQRGSYSNGRGSWSNRRGTEYKKPNFSGESGPRSDSSSWRKDKIIGGGAQDRERGEYKEGASTLMLTNTAAGVTLQTEGKTKSADVQN
jgi:hypothetical protein